MLETTFGAVQLPWAGDCATTFIPDDTTPGGPPAWLDFCIRWQSFSADSGGSISPAARRAIGRAKWAIGACRGARGLVLTAPIKAGDRLFRIGAGWPVFTSLDAQNAGRSDEIVIHADDYGRLSTVLRKVFTKMQETEYWKGTKLTHEKLTAAATEAGETTSSEAVAFLAKEQTIQIPRSRPHFRK